MHDPPRPGLDGVVLVCDVVSTHVGSIRCCDATNDELLQEDLLINRTWRQQDLMVPPAIPILGAFPCEELPCDQMGAILNLNVSRC